jgi:hypothetical protein
MLAGLAEVMLRFLILTATTCIGVRYLLPVLFTTLAGPLCAVVVLLAALLVLPEFWISTACRRGGGGPPHLAYLYGNGVCWLAGLGHQNLRLVLRSLARAAYAIPPLATALVVVTWQLVRVLPWWSQVGRL